MMLWENRASGINKYYLCFSLYERMERDLEVIVPLKISEG
jgi:hypothetical protein